MSKTFSRLLCTAAAGVLLSGFALPGLAWDKWEAFKQSNVSEDFRVIDFSSGQRITTSEGQSYALFFALAAGDKQAFEKLLTWTENNLAEGSLQTHKPAWLWGRRGTAWRVIDSNNAADSDMWIAYALLEAGRLWAREDYSAKGRAMLELLKQDVREIRGLGKVLLPGHSGFEQEKSVTLNPSYYPVFLLRRFALEDDEWNAVIEGTVRALVRSSPRGFVPDWVRFDRQGKVVAETGDDYVIGSYNAIRTYMWAAMMSAADPVREVLVERFEPFAQITRRSNMPPEKIHVLTGKTQGHGSPGFAACVLELLGKSPEQDYLRTVVENDPIIAENYYRNTLLLFAIGFDRGVLRFDQNGRLITRQVSAPLTVLPPKARQPDLPQPALEDAQESASATDSQGEAGQSSAADNAESQAALSAQASDEVPNAAAVSALAPESAASDVSESGPAPTAPEQTPAPETAGADK